MFALFTCTTVHTCQTLVTLLFTLFTLPTITLIRHQAASQVPNADVLLSTPNGPTALTLACTNMYIGFVEQLVLTSSGQCECPVLRCCVDDCLWEWTLLLFSSSSQADPNLQESQDCILRESSRLCFDLYHHHEVCQLLANSWCTQRPTTPTSWNCTFTFQSVSILQLHGDTK